MTDTTTPISADLQHVVLTGVGKDHPGILDDTAAHLLAQGGRILETHIGRLRGQAVMLVCFACDAEARQRITDGLPSLGERTALRLELKDAPESEAHGRALRLVAHRDGEGAASPAGGKSLRAVSNLMRVLNINITDAQITQGPADWHLALIVDVPRNLPDGKLRELLGQLMTEHTGQWDLVTL